MLNKQQLNKSFKQYSKFLRENSGGDDFPMDEETYYQYLSRTCYLLTEAGIVSAEDFVKTGDERMTRKRMKEILKDNLEEVKKALIAKAYEATSDSWRVRRCALVAAYKGAGLATLAKKEIKTLKNPIKPSERIIKPKKAERMQRVTNNEYVMIRNALKEPLKKGPRKGSPDKDAQVVMVLMSTTGCRPCELNRMSVIETSDNSITISISTGKKRKKGDRAIDRVLTINHKNPEGLARAVKHAQDLTAKRIRASQENVRRISQELFPDRKRKFCFYSLRYTMGSNLKRALYDTPGGRLICAAIMGHKNTSSLSEYGRKEFGSKSSKIPVPSKETIAMVQDDVAARFGQERGASFSSLNIKEKIEEYSQYKEEMKMIDDINTKLEEAGKQALDFNEILAQVNEARVERGDEPISGHAALGRAVREEASLKAKAIQASQEFQKKLNEPTMMHGDMREIEDILDAGMDEQQEPKAKLEYN